MGFIGVGGAGVPPDPPVIVQTEEAGWTVEEQKNGIWPLPCSAARLLTVVAL